MTPETFRSTYPHLFCALLAMKDEKPPSGNASNPVTMELSAAINAAQSLAPIVESVFQKSPDPNDLMRFSLSAYGHLGGSDNARIFMRRVWADVASDWPPERRSEFLSVIIRDRRDIFET